MQLRLSQRSRSSSKSWGSVNRPDQTFHVLLHVDLLNLSSHHVAFCRDAFTLSFSVEELKTVSPLPVLWTLRSGGLPCQGFWGYPTWTSPRHLAPRPWRKQAYGDPESSFRWPLVFTYSSALGQQHPGSSFAGTIY